MATPQVWNAKTYDAARRRLVPDFDAFYGTAALLVAHSTPPSPRILDAWRDWAVEPGAQ